MDKTSTQPDRGKWQGFVQECLQAMREGRYVPFGARRESQSDEIAAQMKTAQTRCYWNDDEDSVII